MNDRKDKDEMVADQNVKWRRLQNSLSAAVLDAKAAVRGRKTKQLARRVAMVRAVDDDADDTGELPALEESAG